MYDADSHKGAQKANRGTSAPNTTVGSEDQSSNTVPGLDDASFSCGSCLGCALILNFGGDKSSSGKVTLVSAHWTEKVANKAPCRSLPIS